MDSNKILKSDYLDILFEGRNKAYGGYELRKTYKNRVYRTLMVLGALGLLTAGYTVYANMEKQGPKTVINTKEVTLAEPPPIDPNKPPPPPPPPAPPPPVKPTVAFTPPVIKKDEEVKEDEKPPEQEKLEDKSISTVTKEGDPNGIDAPIVDPGPGKVVEAAPAPPKIYDYVEQQPEFNGNVQKYLAEHITYPEAASSSGIEGKVYVRFVVNEEGNVSDAKVVKGIGGGCDEEAARAIRSMPRWKPGKQNGEAVKCYFTQVVVFKLQGND